MTKKLAVFIDRDGVINRDPGNFHKIEGLQIFPRVEKAIKLFNKYKIPVIVVTNQPVVARGWITEKGVEEIHRKIENILEEYGTNITKFYFCPHHPNANLVEYRVDCECRKPKTRLFKLAAKEFTLDLKKSFVIGDSFRDIESAKNIGCKSIAVESGSSDFRDSKPDYKVKDLYEAAELIISQVT